MHESMAQHSLVSGGIAAVIVALVVLVNWISKRRRNAKQDEILERAAEQMRETGIVLSLLPSGPDQVRRVQEELKDRKLYTGTPDGTLDAETVSSLHALAKAEHVDLDEEVQLLLAASGDFPPCPTALRESRALHTAMERLSESNAPMKYYADRRDRIA